MAAVSDGNLSADESNIYRKSIGIYLVHESTLTHSGLGRLLEVHRGIELCGVSHSIEGALEERALAAADVLLISANFPVAGLARISAETGGRLPVILLADGPVDQAELAEVGVEVSGVVLAGYEQGVLVPLIRVVAEGYVVTAREAVGESLPGRPQPGALDVLTEREREVLRLVALGMTNAEIAVEMTRSESTVKSHVQNVLRKLGLPNRASAIATYYQVGTKS